MPGLIQNRIRYAVARDLIANDIESDRLVAAFAPHQDLDRRALAVPSTGPRLSVVFRLSVFLPLTSMITSPGRMPALYAGDPLNGAMHDRLAVAALHRHADAVVVAALFVAQRLEIVGIEEVGVRIERPQHPRDRAFIDGLVRLQLIGEILLDDVVDFGECLEALIEGSSAKWLL